MTTTQHEPKQSVDAALALDVMAGMLIAGQPLTTALGLLGQHLPGCAPLTQVSARLGYGLDWKLSWALVEDDRELTALRDELDFAARSQVASADVLQSAASTLRRNRCRRAEKLASELGIRLVLPLGACLLPSFICLGVIPLVIALLP